MWKVMNSVDWLKKIAGYGYRMFAETCKRLRIMKRSEAKGFGLHPRGAQRISDWSNEDQNWKFNLIKWRNLREFQLHSFYLMMFYYLLHRNWADNSCWNYNCTSCDNYINWDRNPWYIGKLNCLLYIFESIVNDFERIMILYIYV